MSTIDEYDAEYRGHVQAAEEKLGLAEQLGPHSDSGRTAAHAAERAIEAAKDVAQLMELEGRTLSAGGRSKLQSSLRGYRSEISVLRERLRVLRAEQRTPKRSAAANEDRIREECFAGGDR